MRNGERFFIWLLLVVSIAAGSYITVKVNKENSELRSALYRIHQNQDQLNENFKQFSQATEQALSRQAEKTQGISSQIGQFRGTRDTESGAVVWD
jgi:hypothetical protein